ncbi:zinc finger protein AEBP2 [Triangularia setosa]|uniref:Zinc finger protein AEBP2 n=1 Tax=Triangularia setosa TaxID=2587417 RepID=A0AAN7A5V1_9PEZI|nr:zinc finger protein AEBP2 [Podospora setosa]
MQRSSSQSTANTNFTYASSQYSYTTDMSSVGSPIVERKTYGDGWPTSSYHPQPQDSDQLVANVGYHLHDNDLQAPQDLQLYTTPLQAFEYQIPDIAFAAEQATNNASHAAANDYNNNSCGTDLFVITFDQVNYAQQQLLSQSGQGSDLLHTEAVQQALSDCLCYQFRNLERASAETINCALDEAAYHLQLEYRRTGVTEAQIPDICQLAICGILRPVKDLLRDESDASAALVTQPPHGFEGSSSSILPPSEKQTYPCLVPGCNQKAFSRSADLDRHYKQVHIDEDKKTKFICDYKKCPRHELPFYRQDHFRDHLRDFHKEDLLRRSKKENDKWWDTRAPRAVYSGWWRCNRCLMERVQVAVDGYTCPGCGNPCESERARKREEYAREFAS